MSGFLLVVVVVLVVVVLFVLCGADPVERNSLRAPVPYTLVLISRLEAGSDGSAEKEVLAASVRIAMIGGTYRDG